MSTAAQTLNMYASPLPARDEAPALARASAAAPERRDLVAIGMALALATLVSTAVAGTLVVTEMTGLSSYTVAQSTVGAGTIHK